MEEELLKRLRSIENQLHEVKLLQKKIFEELKKIRPQEINYPGELKGVHTGEPTPF